MYKLQVILGETTAATKEKTDTDQPNRGIRGRRKPLYNKTNNINTRPIKNITSNLVRNVTSVLKSNTPLKTGNAKQAPTSKGSILPVFNRVLKPPSGVKATANRNSPKTSSPVRTVNYSKSKLERQGTFTKPEQDGTVNRSRIPTTAISGNAPISRISRAIMPTNSIASKTVGRNQNVRGPAPPKNPTSRIAVAKSSSADRSATAKTTFNRSSSADSQDSAFNKRNNIQSSSSSQSLKSDNGKKSKRPSPTTPQRSNSNSSIVSNGSAKKQVTSKIASLWKKVEEQKKMVPKKDTRLWIQPTNVER